MKKNLEAGLKHGLSIDDGLAILKSCETFE
jgi:hypothetical protein